MTKYKDINTGISIDIMNILEKITTVKMPDILIQNLFVT